HFAGANPFGPSIDHGMYGEAVAAYYTLAWLDRYVAGKRSAQARLTASGRQRFGASVDKYSIGSGLFDAAKARRRNDPERGNVPTHHRGKARPQPVVVGVCDVLLVRRGEGRVGRCARRWPLIPSAIVGFEKGRKLDVVGNGDAVCLHPPPRRACHESLKGF